MLSTVAPGQVRAHRRGAAFGARDADARLRAARLPTDSRSGFPVLGPPLTRSREVAAVMVAWNSMSWLPAALDSLERQTHPFTSIHVVDNASEDGIVDYLARNHPQVAVIRNSGNLGFAEAVNQGIRGSHAEWVFVLNPDLALEPDHLSSLLTASETRPDAGMLGGLLLRPDGSVDSAGLELRRFLLRPLDRMPAEVPAGAPVEPVFGICAAAALYRRAMLEDVAFHGEYMDSAFFAYYEDVDLAWRARHRGWRAYFVPAARGMHVRGASKGEVSRAGRIRSQRNRYLALFKNLSLRGLLLDLVPVVGIEVARMMRHFDTQAAGLWAALRLVPSRRAWRSHIQRTSKSSPEWFLKT